MFRVYVCVSQSTICLHPLQTQVGINGFFTLNIWQGCSKEDDGTTLDVF